MKKYLAFFSLTVFLSGCSTTQKEPVENLLNIASVYCLESGGEFFFEETKTGGTGFCKMPDGTYQNEWQKYRKENKIP